MLRLAAMATYVVTWGLLLLGLLVSGEWVGASILTAVLVGLWRLPVPQGSARGPVLGGTAAITAGVLWAAEPVVEALTPSPAGIPWPWLGASLILVVAIVEVRSVEVLTQRDVGGVAWVLGFLPVFLSAAVAGNVLAPIAGVLVSDYVAFGTLMLAISTAPFAIVASWYRAVPWQAAAILVVGSILQAGLGIAGASLASPLLVGATLVYGAGWIALGWAIIRVHGMDDGAPADQAAGQPPADSIAAHG